MSAANATAEPEPSLSVNSAARFASDGVRLFVATVTGVLTARVLGPYGKGTLASLLFIAEAFLAYVATFGLDEAVLVLVGARRDRAQEFLSAGLSIVPIGAALLALLFWPLAVFADWGGIAVSVALAAASMATLAHLRLFAGLLNANEQLVATSGAMVAVSVTTMAATVVLLPLLGLGLEGAVGASLIGGLVGLVIMLWGLTRRGLRLRPSWRPNLLRKAIPLGISLQTSQLLVVASLRVDLLIVYAMSGEVDAGHYSVALTMTQTVSVIAIALSASSFPRLARLSGRERLGLTARAMRLTMVGQAAGVALLAGLIPLLTVPLYGSAFAPTIPIAFALLPGSFVSGLQWVLARSSAAAGDSRSLLVSYIVHVAVMLGLDVLLVPSFGPLGAAAATLAGAAAGLVVSIRRFQRSVPEASVRLLLVPIVSDVRLAASVSRDLVRGVLRYVRTFGRPAA